ncbi:MAG: N-formylglutamate amidohydrolase [Pseudobdellovibrionaceae bacterium]
MSLPFFVTIPHSGEKLPDFCTWLQGLPEEVLMCDVDRYVDRLYEPSLQSLQIPWIKTEWHRYAADLNRIPADVDESSVIGNPTKTGTHSRGFHWVVTTTGIALMKEPIPQAVHEKLVQLIYEPFHQKVRDHYIQFEKLGHKKIFHLDAHSMPSVGTKMHKDPGEKRADIVVSDCLGKSAQKEFVDLVIAAYTKAGFKVAYNWPYVGGRVSEQYGEPSKGHHTVQVEMNRALYMDEVSKKLKPDLATDVTKRVERALKYIQVELPRLI